MVRPELLTNLFAGLGGVDYYDEIERNKRTKYMFVVHDRISQGMYGPECEKFHGVF